MLALAGWLALVVSWRLRGWAERIAELVVPLLLAVVASAAIHLVAVIVPGLRPVFRTYAMTLDEWVLLLGLAALIVPAVEVAKLVYRSFWGRASAPAGGSSGRGAPAPR